MYTLLIEGNHMWIILILFDRTRNKKIKQGPHRKKDRSFLLVKIDIWNPRKNLLKLGLASHHKRTALLSFVCLLSHNTHAGAWRHWAFLGKHTNGLGYNNQTSENLKFILQCSYRNINSYLSSFCFIIFSVALAINSEIHLFTA